MTEQITPNNFKVEQVPTLGFGRKTPQIKDEPHPEYGWVQLGRHGGMTRINMYRIKNKRLPVDGKFKCKDGQGWVIQANKIKAAIDERKAAGAMMFHGMVGNYDRKRRATRGAFGNMATRK